MSAANEYFEIIKEYKKLKEKVKTLGETNKKLNEENHKLVSENTILKEIISEKFEIERDVLYANIKMLRREKQTRDNNIRIKKFIEMSKEYTKQIKEQL